MKQFAMKSNNPHAAIAYHSNSVVKLLAIASALAQCEYFAEGYDSDSGYTIINKWNDDAHIMFTSHELVTPPDGLNNIEFKWMARNGFRMESDVLARVCDGLGITADEIDFPVDMDVIY